MSKTNKRILVVDDDALLQELLVMTMEMEGYQVTAASNGKQAMDLARAEQFDMILLDMMMPVLDGIRFLQFKSTFKSPTVPVLVLTAVHDQEKISNVLQAGASQVLSKPVDTQVLLETVSRFL